MLGKPEEFARRYYEEGADELLYMDIVASLYQRNSLLDIVERTSREIFIPLTVGGGLRSLSDIKAVLRAGADKVSLNTAAIADPELVRAAALDYGSSTIVVSVEAKRRPDGRYEAYTDCGRERTGKDAIDWAQQAAELGAGEILVTSIDNEGTGNGFDVELTAAIAARVEVPVIACGGAGSVEHVAAAAKDGRASAVCVASLLHYEHLKRFPSPGAARGFSRIKEASLGALKGHLDAQGVRCRPVAGAGRGTE